MIETEERDQEPEENDDSQVHTSAEEGHPAGEGERSDRDIGGPTSPDDPPEEDFEGAGPSTTPEDEDLESHE
ncbi:MAG: hypothetical protein JOZ25_09330 [Actinobacteria bacterium]|nr:hypothetical protein [Actinomycetota bacterium]